MANRKRQSLNLSNNKNIKSFAVRKLYSVGVKKVRRKDISHIRLREISVVYKKHFNKELEEDYYNWFYSKKFCDDNDTIYFIGNLQYGFVKIGYSKNPSKRLSGIQTGCPFSLSILKTEQGNLDHEKMYHKKFKKLNTNGEWFKIDGDLKEYLNIEELNTNQ